MRSPENHGRSEREGVFPLGKFCFFTALCAPGESLWSLLHKFSFWNQIGGRDLKDLMRDSSLAKSEIIRLRSGHSVWDLRSHLAYDDSHLQRMFSDPHRSLLARATLDQVQDRAEYFASRHGIPNVRMCPECFRIGCHFSCFQSEELIECPAHRIQLINACPRCDSEIPMSPPKNADAEAFKCACGKFMWDRSFTRKRAEDIAKIATVIEPIEKLLRPCCDEKFYLVAAANMEEREYVYRSFLITAVRGDPIPRCFRAVQIEPAAPRVLPNSAVSTKKFLSLIESDYLNFRALQLSVLSADRAQMLAEIDRATGHFDGTCDRFELPPCSDPVVATIGLWRLFWERTLVKSGIATYRVRPFGRALCERLSGLYDSIPGEWGDTFGVDEESSMPPNVQQEHTRLLLAESFESTLLESSIVIRHSLQANFREVSWTQIDGVFVRSKVCTRTETALLVHQSTTSEQRKEAKRLWDRDSKSDPKVTCAKFHEAMFARQKALVESISRLLDRRPSVSQL